MKKKLKNIIFLRFLKSIYDISGDYFRFNPFRFVSRLIWYFGLYKKLRKQKNENFQLSFGNLFICLSDNTSKTPIEPVYFFQDTWLVRKLFEIKPSIHHDIGSSISTIGIISQIIPVNFVDIRPIDVNLPGLNYINGSILNLPFKNNSIETLSSICVIEHIGLGRYGDDIDCFGSEKAIKEIIRVVKPNGYILISVPVDNQNKIVFNAHRTFTRDYIINQFNNCILLEEKYQYGMNLFDEYNHQKGFGTGLFLFKKLN